MSDEAYVSLEHAGRYLYADKNERRSSRKPQRIEGWLVLAPADVLLREADYELSPHIADPRAPGTSGLPAILLLSNPAPIGLMRDDSEDALDVVPEFASDVKEVSPILWAQNNSVPVELAAEHVDLGMKEPNLGISAGLEALAKEMKKDVE